MKVQKSSHSNIMFAVGFFFIWLGILYAGADHPPPAGFVWIIGLDLLAAWLVYLRVPTYVNWSADRTRLRWFRVLLDGFLAGFVFAIIAIVLPVNRDASILPVSIDYAIWFAVLAGVGIANTVLLYFISSVFSRFSARVQ